MIMLRQLFSILLTMMFLALPTGTALAAEEAPEEAKEPTDYENVLYMDVIYGRVMIELYPEIAPNHVERIKTLTRQKFYDRLYFHRVIDGFMAQTGDPNGDGSGNSEYPDLQPEFSTELSHDEGTLSMARSDDPASANSQFFIVFTEEGADHLDGNYTIWGKVIKGMRYVNHLSKGDGPNGSFTDPLDRDRILRMRVAADVIAANEAKEAAEKAEAETAEKTPTEEEN
jgi:peptidylprolyl isomerase